MWSNLMIACKVREEEGMWNGQNWGQTTAAASLPTADTLVWIFIDLLRKAYDAMDRDRCVKILDGYGVGPNILRLIVNCWDQAELVCRASGRYGAPFKAKREVAKGGPL